MTTIKLDPGAALLLDALHGAGHAAYAVGGCVRDSLLGLDPHDWDLCTSARPEQVMALFGEEKCIPTGLQHGTVTVKQGGRLYETTTFRTEGAYSDGRHPDAVCFVPDVREDLARRDFTINAMAYSAGEGLIDPFGGRDDLAAHLVRAVGEPERRFEEDALRMFRALRFSARLGFTIEEKTLSAIEKKAPLAASLAPERVRDEVEKILLTRSPEMVYTLIELGLLDAFLKKRMPEPWRLHRLGSIQRKAMPRWAALCCALEKFGCIDSAEEFLAALRLDSRTIRCCSNAEVLVKQPKPADKAAWKRALCAYGVDSVSCAAQCYDAFSGGGSARELRAVLKSGECFSMKHLAVTGDDLLELGLRGRELGDMLRFLLDYVMEYPANNRRELLLTLARGTEE